MGSRQAAAVAAVTAKAVTWVDELSDTQKALSSGRTEEVVRVAQKHRAELAVVPWPVANAVYTDQLFSVIRISPVGSKSGDLRQR